MEIGRPGETYRRIRIESQFGKLAVFVTDGHLPSPYGRETTGCEVADLVATLAKAKAAGVEVMVPRDVTVSFDWIVQWRENLNDGVYAVPGFLIRAADGSRARFVGHRPGAELRWQANRHLWFQGDYGIFYAGRFLKETQPGRNLNYWALWAGYKF